MALPLFGRKRPARASPKKDAAEPEAPALDRQPVGPRQRRERPATDTSGARQRSRRTTRPAATVPSRRRRGGEATAEEQYVQKALTEAPVAEKPAAPASEARTPAKRTRRGTRGGRRRRKGEEKDGTAPEAVAAPAETVELPVEALLARQTTALETFLAEETRAMKSIQGSLSAIEGRLGGAGSPGAFAPTQLPRVGIFVDVPNIMYAAERFGVNIDFGRLREMLAEHRELVRASAYAPISDDPAARVEQQRFVSPFVGKGYRIVTKPLKRFTDGSMKANFDVELAIDVLTMSDRLDVVCLVSGDGDFRRLVDMVASKGVRVEVVAFASSTSIELRNVADLYIDLTQYLDELRIR